MVVVKVAKGKRVASLKRKKSDVGISLFFAENYH